jgi:phasin family protein
MQPQFIDLYRASLGSAADLMKSSLEQAQRLHQQQLEIVRGALEENERSSQQIAGAKSLDDIFTLNSRVAGAQLERITSFWSSMWQSAAETQKMMADQMHAQVGQASNHVRQGYDFTARTAEEATRLAAAQMNEANHRMRDALAEQEREAQGQRHTLEGKAPVSRKTG